MVTPWNFPAAMATRKLGPALAAGCTAILKPASDAPLTTLAVVHLMEEAGLPPGVVNVVVAGLVGGDRDDAARPPGAQAVVHRVHRGGPDAAQGGLRPGAPSLDGARRQRPFLVFEDADLDAALEGAMVAKMRNAGEACTAANRFLVHSTVAESSRRCWPVRWVP